MPPPSDTADPPARQGLRERMRTLSRTRRELLGLALALLAGVLLMPLLIWMAGNRVLGPYTHGQDLHAGPFALLQDFFIGLLHGSAVFWAVALGPAVFILLLRLFVRGLRGRRG
ncbi:MAG TPA: hypothetical protein VLV29_06795 [Steroidobacteraceae bacterium]|nr:hypothetical protein [Steroidobacteraceae bacterium]